VHTTLHTTLHTNLHIIREDKILRQSLGETSPLSQDVQVGWEALRTRHTHGTEVRKKRPRGLKKEA
jgi:hypothetical protein